MDKNTIDFHIPRWEELPNIDLYMDQVVSFIEESLTVLVPSKDKEDNKEVITKTMINNYVKHGILTPPINKKYNRTHLARLIVICILKQVYSINDIDSLIKLALETSGIEISYNKFCMLVEKCIDSTFKKEEFVYPNEELTEERYLLKTVVETFVNKLYVQKTFLNK